MLARLLEGDHVHEARWVGGVGAHFAVNFDEALHQDGLGFTHVERILEASGPVSDCRFFLVQGIPVAKKDDQRHAITEFVRTWDVLTRWVDSRKETASTCRGTRLARLADICLDVQATYRV
jgi:hypothetical protein